MVLNFSSMESSNSSVCYPDFTTSKPAKKVKLRNIFLTPSSLLLGVDKSENSKHVPAYKMEEKLQIVDGKRIYPDEFSSGSPLFGESKRTEDIFIREDEDGIRSHYCPLVSDFDRVRHGSKDCSDSETENEFNTSSSLPWKASYWRQPLTSGTRTPSSESEGSSDESIRYVPLENQPAANENSPKSSLNRFLQFFHLHERNPALDKKTMERWQEDSSDEFDEPIVKDPELPLISVGNESDMEEFEKDSDTEIENGSVQTTEDKNEGDNKDNGNKDLVIDSKSSRSDTKNESGKESSNELSVREHPERKDTDENGYFSYLNNTDDDEIHEGKLNKKSETNSTAQDFNDEQKKDSEADRKSDDSEQYVLDDFRSESQTEMSSRPKNEENKIKDSFQKNISESTKRNEMQPNDSRNGSVDYAPVENQPTTNEISPVSSSNRHLSPLTERIIPFDKSTVGLWLEGSSDNFGNSIVENHELPPRDSIPNESETEEFEQYSETEIVTESLQTTEGKNQGDKKDYGNKNLVIDSKSSQNDTENESNKGSSDELPESEHPERKDTGENALSSDLINLDDDESHEEKFDKKSETNSTAQDFNDKQNKEWDSEGDRKSDDSEQDVPDDFPSESQTEMSARPKGEENMIKNPFETNISESLKKSESQVDYGDKLYYETSTETEAEKHLKEKEILSDELTFTEIPILDNRSDVLEPVLIEEQRVPSRPRNRLVRFFQTFKKKFEKNKKP